ncbi:hypothetical protein V496_09325, partial [Pseudogymnoascus sp. VKM F-4515 (FW-2607)]
MATTTAAHAHDTISHHYTLHRRLPDDDKPYFPHPAPPSIPSPPTPPTPPTMSSPATTTLLATFLVPLAVAAALYVLLTYALIPLYQRHHARYSSYLPLTALSTSTSTFRARLQANIAEYMLPAGWRTDFNAHQYQADSRSGSEAGDDAGEELYEFVAGRRGGVSLDARRGGRGGGEEVSRLSRDLEEGFADDSSDDGEGIERLPSTLQRRKSRARFIPASLEHLDVTIRRHNKSHTPSINTGISQNTNPYPPKTPNSSLSAYTTIGTQTPGRHNLYLPSQNQHSLQHHKNTNAKHLNTELHHLAARSPTMPPSPSATSTTHSPSPHPTASSPSSPTHPSSTTPSAPSPASTPSAPATTTPAPPPSPPPSSNYTSPADAPRRTDNCNSRTSATASPLPPDSPGPRPQGQARRSACTPGAQRGLGRGGTIARNPGRATAGGI